MRHEIRELFAYNRWANHRLLDAAAQLTPEQRTRDLRSSFPSVLATLAHIAAAEWIWLERCRGVSPTGLPAEWDLSTLEALRWRWAEVEREQRALLEDLREADMRRVLAYRDTRGTAYTSQLWRMLRHVVNHSTYHRGQVVTMLRQLGTSAVATDLIVFYREEEAMTTVPE